jgi:hypothetical protein
MYSIRILKIIPFCGFAILAGHTLLRGHEMRTIEKKPPTVIRAVAPPFIPFVFNETAVAEVVVEARIDPQGKVTLAKMISASYFRDSSFEDAAKQWLFEPSNSKEQRIANIKFVMRIMPKTTLPSELTTIYRYPAEIEIRSPVFTPHITADPLPIKEERPKQKSKP